MSLEPLPRPRRAEWPLLLLLGAVLFMALCATWADPDLWGHLRFGQDTLANGGVVRTDPYSFRTEPGAWVNHEWLAEVSFALAYNALGVRGLVTLKVLVGLGALTALLVHLRRRSERWVGPVLMTGLATLAVLPMLRPVRPQLYTVGLLTALLLVLVAHEQGRQRVLWATVPIMALWVNLHGGVLAGAGLLAGWYGARALERLWRLRREGLRGVLRCWREIVAPGELAPVLLALAATLANPYGWRLPAFLLRTATVPRPEIQDWQPAALNSYYGVVYLVSFGLGLTVYLKSPRRPSFGQSMVLAALAVAAVTAVRHVSLFGLGVTILAGPGLMALLPGAKPRQAGQGAPRGGLVWQITQGLCLLAALGAFGYGLYLAGRICIVPDFYPLAAVRFLDAHVDAANMVTPYNWGEYIIWHLGPEIQVSMDGRCETVYDEAIYQQSMAWHHGTRGWDAQVDDAASELALTMVREPAYSLMKLKPGWVSVYEDDLAAIYAREGSALAERLQAAAPAAPDQQEGPAPADEPAHCQPPLTFP